ncbi:hypothetical protein SADUNF_Sadunf06G0049100 [Salix dunnii]|uniref:Uncharacterized protein n=1 Tax=Salix dunnii TaxID=1413687 RepID=A0A835K354_9ROSI|nr:hypothetical protein SADUNF_Sadunf06G0049100 [Salix dunnii]
MTDLNDLAILSYHSRLSQQGKRKKKSEGVQQHAIVSSKSIRDSPLNTGKQLSRKTKTGILPFYSLGILKGIFQACFMTFGCSKYSGARKTSEEERINLAKPKFQSLPGSDLASVDNRKRPFY